nr:sensor histidine kinase [uncultured Dyadobacter sp.]
MDEFPLIDLYAFAWSPNWEYTSGKPLLPEVGFFTQSMMTPFNGSDGDSVGHLITFLAERQEGLLNNWRTACERELSSNCAANLNRKQFINKVPLMLDALAERLDGRGKDTDVGILAAEHGLHRWQKGYVLIELVTEMRHLSRILFSEVRAFWELHPLTSATVIAFSYEHLSEFGNQINTGSIAQYADLQRQAASDRAEALQKALIKLNDIGRQRTDLLRHSSHDLRGSFGALQGAAALLEMVIESDQERVDVLEILRRNLTNCRTLVTQLMDLARLEAGQETMQMQRFDAGQLLTDLVIGYQPLAAERGLTLKSDGPAHLDVRCDPVLLQRIIQNLVLNALKHTPSGWVLVAWAAENDNCWSVKVQDTGPGLAILPEAGRTIREPGPSEQPFKDFAREEKEPDTPDAVAMPHSKSTFSYKGEGIGLSIVKELCDLLRADLEIESRQGNGTTFRIKLTNN